MKKYFIFIIFTASILSFNGCGGGGNSIKKENSSQNSLKRDFSNQDSDNDYIPDNIEALIGTNINNNDQNNNGVIDGLESNSKFGDTLFDKEWFIYSTDQEVNNKKHSIKGNDLDLLKVYHHYMGYNNGKFIKVQVVDYGIDVNHEDLKDNISLSDSFNNGEIGNPKYPNYYHINKHGTKIAGLLQQEDLMEKKLEELHLLQRLLVAIG